MHRGCFILVVVLLAGTCAADINDRFLSAQFSDSKCITKVVAPTITGFQDSMIITPESGSTSSRTICVYSNAKAGTFLYQVVTKVATTCEGGRVKVISEQCGANATDCSGVCSNVGGSQIYYES